MMKLKSGNIWDESEGQPKPGIENLAELEAWESEMGVRLPILLRDALLVRNGGRLCYSETVISSLADISRVDGEFWELAVCGDEEFSDRSLFFSFAESQGEGPAYFLDFNANGPLGEPAVYHYYGGLGDISFEAESVAEFVLSQTAASDTPSVSMNEKLCLDSVIHEEIHSRGQEAGGGTIETVVGFRDDLLWIYRHEITEERETIEKTGLAKPFHPEAIITAHPSNPPSFSLRIDTRKSDKSRGERSEKLPGGKWKQFSEDGPICAFVDSANKAALINLRNTILGERLIPRAEKAQREHDELVAQSAAMAALPVEERQALGLEMAKNLMKQMNPSLDLTGMGKDDLSKEIGRMMKEKLGGL